MSEPRVQTIEEIMDEVSQEELDLWVPKGEDGEPNGKRRRCGNPAGQKESYDKRDSTIVDVASVLCAGYSQSIRHIYYKCSGLGLVGKDHGKETYWYTVVANAVGKTRWDTEDTRIGWADIADDTRTFNVPYTWEDAQGFVKSQLPLFKTDLWKGQEKRVVICTEKDAILSMLSTTCFTQQVPLVSFHGQLSDGALYTLAEQIASWKGQCEVVWCYYLGDFDTCGCVIDRAVFGDPLADDIDKKMGKLTTLLLSFFEDTPTVCYERIATTHEDVCNDAYAAYILPANKDTNLERFLADTNGDSRTLGVDALSHEELNDRVESVINQHKNDTAWDEQEDYLRTQRDVLLTMFKK